MKKIFLLTVACLLWAGMAVGQTVALGPANITDNSNRDVVIVGDFAYCAIGEGRVYRVKP